MPFSRFLPCALTVAGMVLAAVALRNPSARWARADGKSEPPRFAVLEKAAIDPEAVKLVNQVIDRLTEPRLGWLETSLWMKMHLPDLCCEGDGSYLRAPGQRFRLEMRTHLEGLQTARTGERGRCTTLSVGDGHDLWSACRIGSTPWRNITRLRISTILDAPHGPATLPQVRQEFLAGWAMQGVERLMRSLHDHIEWVHRTEGKSGVCLSGRWIARILPVLLEQKKSWPAMLPRFCRLTLRGSEPWPSRLEWWGPVEENGPDQLLVEMEFRDPVFDRVVSPALLGGLFTFDPGSATVEDLTPRIRADLDARAKQLAAMGSARQSAKRSAQSPR